MTTSVRRDLLWMLTFVAVLVALRVFFWTQERVVFEAEVPSVEESLTPLFSVPVDTTLLIEVARKGAGVAQQLEVELVDENGLLLGHEPLFIDKRNDASGSLFFTVNQGDASLRFLRGSHSTAPLRVTVSTGKQSNSHFGFALLALLVPPLLRLAGARRTFNRQGSTHGT